MTTAAMIMIKKTTQATTIISVAQRGRESFRSSSFRAPTVAIPDKDVFDRAPDVDDLGFDFVPYGGHPVVDSLPFGGHPVVDSLPYGGDPVVDSLPYGGHPVVDSVSDVGHPVADDSVPDFDDPVVDSDPKGCDCVAKNERNGMKSLLASCVP